MEIRILIEEGLGYLPRLFDDGECVYNGEYKSTASEALEAATSYAEINNQEKVAA